MPKNIYRYKNKDTDEEKIYIQKFLWTIYVYVFVV